MVTSGIAAEEYLRTQEAYKGLMQAYSLDISTVERYIDSGALKRSSLCRQGV